MVIHAVLCALVVCSAFRGALNCQGRDVWDISQVLADVRDWKGLADVLNIRSTDIETNCAQEVPQASCCRRELVRRYCDRQSSENPSKVAEDIAEALEQMGHKLQAQQLRKLELDRGRGTVDKEGNKKANEADTAQTQQLLQELAESQTLPDRPSVSESAPAGVAAVQANISHLRQQFDSLRTATWQELEKAGISVDSLLDTLHDIPYSMRYRFQVFLAKYDQILDKCKDIRCVFRKLSLHWNYLNIDIWSHLISKFLLQSLYPQLEAYKEELEHFMEWTTLKEYYDVEGDQEQKETPDGFITLVSKHTWESPIYLKKVDDFRRKLARKYDLHTCAVLLVSIKRSSVIVTMMLPESIVVIINSSDTEFFKEHGIIHLQLNGTCVYKQTEDEVSPSAVQPTLEGQSQFFPGAAVSVSVVGTTGNDASLTAITHAAASSPSLGPRPRKPYPLLPIETAVSSAESGESTEGSISEPIQQKWAGGLVAVIAIVISTCALYCFTRGRENERHKEKGKEKVLDTPMTGQQSQGPSGRQSAVLASQPTQPSLPQYRQADYSEHQTTSPAEEEYDFVEEPLNDMVCPVTKTVMLEPHQTDCCGNHLSAEGADVLQQKREACPLCRKPGFTSRPDQYFRRKVHELRVRCPHRRRGCEWVGELSNMDHHVESCPRKNSPLETDLAQLPQPTPQSRAQRRELEERERVRNKIELCVKEKNVRMRGSTWVGEVRQSELAQEVGKEHLTRTVAMDGGREGSRVERQMRGGREEVFEASRPVQNVTIQAPATLSPSQTVTSPSSTIKSSPLMPSHVVTLSPPTPSPSPLTRYADYLRAVYTKSPVAIDDKWPPTPSTTYIRLALVKKEKVSQGEADHFTRLTLQGHIDQILQAKQPIAMDDILKDLDTRLVVVEGAPGIGKSTLAWELCRQWPTLESLRYFSLVVLLRLREEGVQTAKAISDLLYHHNTELCRCVGEEVERKEGEGVLLVFDGFDEFPTDFRGNSLVTEVISGSYLPKATVLLTSRPSATAQLLSTSQVHVGKHIEVMGFSDKEIQEYAESIFGCGLQLLASFQTYLSVNPVVKGMMHNPLNCGMVVDVYRESSLSHRPIPHTQTQLYAELSLCLLSRHLSAAGDPLARRLPDRLEDIPHDSDLYQQLVRLGRLAFEGRVKEEVIFKRLPEGCSALGLLNTCSELYRRREKVTYNFLHLTLQEYLGAFYISQLPASKQGELFVEHRKLEHLNVVWRFVAGLTRMQAIGWEGFRGRWVKKEDRGNVYSGYVVEGGVVRVWPSVVQCLYEAQDARSCASVFGQSRVQYHGMKCTTPFDAYAVGYCISLSRNDWNVDMSDNGLGPEVMEMLVCTCGLKSVQYGGGSVGELRLSGNPITDEGMKLLQQFPHQILQQMKRLLLSECGLGQTEFDLFADTVPLLSSLESLDISYNPGGNGSTVKLLQALGKLQRVEHLKMVGTVIGADDAMALPEVVQPSGSLRQLTIGSEHMSPECVQEVVRTVLSPSSLRTVEVKVPSSESPLHCIETLSDNLTRLKFLSLGSSSGQLPAELSCSRLSKILKKNTILEVLVLHIPLGNTEVRAIVESLKHNHILTELRLSERCHSQYFSESERQALDNRIKWGW